MKFAPPTLFTLQGVKINLASIENAVSAIISGINGNASSVVFTLNLDHLVKLRTNAAFRDAYHRADFVTADGFPIVTLARMADIALERTAGSDLIEPLCVAAAARHHPVFLFGTTPQALTSAARHLTRQVQGLQIAGCFSPPTGFGLRSQDYRTAIDRIGKSRAQLCFVALGAPLQELFSAAAASELHGVTFVCIGAGLDFIAGNQTRCPAYFRKLNLEWAWRLFSNPRRLGPRYIRCAMLFARLLVSARLKRYENHGSSTMKTAFPNVRNPALRPGEHNTSAADTPPVS